MPLVLFLALVLASPGLAARTRVVALLVGGFAMFAVAVGMLTNDIETLELGGAWPLPPDAAGPFGWPARWMRGLHGTAAAAILPIVVWALFLGSEWRLRLAGADAPERG